jgi:hypothetical protein
MRNRHRLPRLDLGRGLGRGWRGIQGIIADPDDARHVFAVLEAFSGASLARMYGRFVRTPVAARLASTFNNYVFSY